MNIAPPSDDVEASQAPFMGAAASSSGDLPDRMVGSGGGKRPGDASGDLKKAPPGKSSSISSSLDLKKPAASKKKLKDSLDDKKDKEKFMDPLDEDLDEGDDDDADDREEEEDKSSSDPLKNKQSSSASASTGGDEKSATPKKRRIRKKWKKPKDKPTRPLSAYNLFFRKERAEMLGDSAPPALEKGQKRVHRKTHGKIGKLIDLAGLLFVDFIVNAS